MWKFAPTFLLLASVICGGESKTIRLLKSDSSDRDEVIVSASKQDVRNVLYEENALVPAERQAGCNTEITQHGQVFRTPNHPNKYPHNEDCAVLVRFPAGSRISLNFLAFDIETHSSCAWDWLEVREGDSPDSPLIIKMCGGFLPQPIESTGNTMFLKFHSDYAVARSGVEVRIDELAPAGCGGTIDGPGSMITSPDHPNDYPNNKDCEWIIEYPIGETVHLKFVAFSLERHATCGYDWLEIHDGDSVNSPMIGKYCGTNFPQNITSTQNKLFVHFHSDAYVSSTGFAIDVIQGDRAACGGTINGPGSVITSPDHPNDYPNNKDCEWIIQYDAGQTIQLQFLAFNLERHATCGWDWLEIRDGDSINARLIGKYCGTNFPQNVTSTKNKLFVHFHSDTNVVSTGFEIDVKQGGVTNGPQCGVVPNTRSLEEDERIVNGNETAAHSIPWQVSLGNIKNGKFMHWCGGTILNERYILTAAHCRGRTHVVAKEHSLSASSDGEIHEICNWKNHDNYDPRAYPYDFALVSLKTPIQLDAKAVPACLPTPEMGQNNFLVGKTLTVSGWGCLKTTTSGVCLGSPDVLMTLDKTGVTNAACQETFKRTQITSDMLCASAGPTQDSCNGDSGGPLTLTENGVTTVVGAVSWGTEDCGVGAPGVYARVTSVLDWIANTIDQDVGQCSQ